MLEPTSGKVNCEFPDWFSRHRENRVRSSGIFPDADCCRSAANNSVVGTFRVWMYVVASHILVLDSK